MVMNALLHWLMEKTYEFNLRKEERVVKTQRKTVEAFTRYWLKRGDTCFADLKARWLDSPAGDCTNIQALSGIIGIACLIFVLIYGFVSLGIVGLRGLVHPTVIGLSLVSYLGFRVSDYADMLASIHFDYYSDLVQEIIKQR
jgi:hypothetical protein